MSKNKYFAEYGACQVLKTFLRIAPFNLLMKEADRIGGWIFQCLGIRRDVVLANLKYAFGDYHEGRSIEILAHKTYGHLFRTALELANIRKIMKRMDEFVKFKHIERFRDALQEGKGVLLATGHFGNFELGALALAWSGLPISLVIKPLRNPFIDRELTLLRQSLGAEVNLVNDAGMRILSALRRNRIVCMVGDQDFGQIRGINVQFFGHPTSTLTGTARMALQTQSPISPCFFCCKESGIHVLEVEPEMEVDYSRHVREKEIQRITQDLSFALERWIYIHPEQYFWFHRRWKSTPDGKWLYQRKR